MSFQDFLNKSSTIQNIPSVTSDGFANFLKEKTPITTAITPSKSIEEQPKKGFWNWVGKQLTKPIGVVAEELKGVGGAIGNVAAAAISPKISAEQGFRAAGKSLFGAQKSAAEVITGKKETLISQELKKSIEDAGLKYSTVDKVFGIGGDLFLDPLNFIPFEKGISLLGKGISKIKGVDKIIKAVQTSPVTEKLASYVTNATKNKEFNDIVTSFRNLRQYREGQLIDQAVQLQKDIKVLEKSGIKNAQEIITEGLENPKFRETISNPQIIKIVENLQTTYKDLLTQGKNVGLKIGEIINYAPRIRTKESFLNSLKDLSGKKLGLGAREFGKGKIEAARKFFPELTQKEIREMGGNLETFFEKNPAISLAKKGQMYNKAITSSEFANAIKKFALEEGTVVTNPMLKGLKFDPQVARVIDNYYKTIKPEEIKDVFKVFDTVQNYWKSQALLSPSYHVRNIAGNLWNNYLAGVNPFNYAKAGLIQKGIIKDTKLVEEMKKLGVIDEGWYAKDIGEEVISRVSKGIKQGINPLSQQNYLFRLNKTIGSVLENNARVAHYLSMIDEGMTPAEAAKSVKKFLFDYEDLTDFEKTVMKRVAPFFTWTRKNIPLQLEQLVKQPGKFATIFKAQKEIEAGVEQPDEKYLGAYIRDNIPVRIRTNKSGDTEYFLLGNWLPAAQAINFLGQPFDNIVKMVTPLAKTPLELWFNKSTFFKNTLGEMEPIEGGSYTSGYKEQGEFLGQSMRKKQITLLRNIRILNDLSKWYDAQDRTKVKDSYLVKFLNTMFGKTSTYSPEKSRYYYNKDTEERITAYKSAIKDARSKGYEEQAKKLYDEMQRFIQNRGR